jgi:hypothetical protein
LAAALAVSKKMAENAGVDLSDALRDLKSAIAEAYPKSDAAKTYPREVAAARAHIDAALAARRQRNGARGSCGGILGSGATLVNRPAPPEPSLQSQNDC